MNQGMKNIGQVFFQFTTSFGNLKNNICDSVKTGGKTTTTTTKNNL